MVTWDGIFQFCMLIAAVIALVFQVNNQREVTANSHSLGYFSVIRRGTDLLAAPLYS